MKLCKDCKHSRGRECFAPQNIKSPDLVDGSLRRRWDYCSTHRDHGILGAIFLKVCGKRGRWFEQRDEQKQ